MLNKMSKAKEIIEKYLAIEPRLNYSVELKIVLKHIAELEQQNKERLECLARVYNVLDEYDNCLDVAEYIKEIIEPFLVK